MRPIVVLVCKVLHRGSGPGWLCGLRRLVIFALLGAACSVQAQRELLERPPVTDLRLLLLQALDSPQGRAHGKLVGEWADAITKKFSGAGIKAGEILVDVHTLQRYAQAGCSRLNIRLVQDGVVLPGAKAPRLQTMDVGLNYCRDGQPPKSLAVATSSSRQ